MTSLSDTLTMGLVLVLLFGSIALYLYTRVQQTEQKISLLESILLDLKMSSEIKSYDIELPVMEHIAPESSLLLSSEQNNENYISFDESLDNELSKEDVSDKSERVEVSNTESIEVSQYKDIIAAAVKDTVNTTTATTETTTTATTNDTSVNTQTNSKEKGIEYESMTLKELQALAKSRDINCTGMKKGIIIEALKTSDRTTSTMVEPGYTGTGTFLETSSTFLRSDDRPNKQNNK